MKTLKTILATLFFVALAVNSNGQNSNWSHTSTGAKLDPATANLGIGADPSAKAKLRLNSSTSSTDTVFGLYSTMGGNSVNRTVYGIHSTNTNTAANHSTPLYGAYFKNTQSGTSANVSGLLYGIYLDNSNTTYGNTNYGVYVKNKITGYAGTTYGFYVDNSTGGNSGSACGFYANNSGGGPMGSMYGIELINNKTGTGGGDVFGVHSTNTTGASINSVYGAYLSSKHTSTGVNASVYGIYSTVEGGAPDKRWAGYFTGGNVAVMQGSVGIGTNSPQAKLQIDAEGNPSNIETNPNNGLMIKGSDQALYMGVNSTSHVSYIQSVDWGTTVAPLLLNARGGNVGIGTTNPTVRLEVAGTVRAREFVANLSAGADFVFAEDYALKPLDEVYHFIQTNKHLPEIPSAADMINNGLEMGEFQIKLLQKIEELTLYVIEQDKRLKMQQDEINRLKNR